ncbi:MAG: MFS transporter [Rhodospirillaceae bacterium]|nr:MFS transporter [Rhodospirillaceae bacterium]
MTDAPTLPPDQPARALTPPVAATLFAAIALMVVGQSFLFTILPPIGRQIGLAEYQIGLVMSVHGLFMLFTGPTAGALSETWGRRRVLVIGSALYAVSILMFGLVIEAALQGLFAAVTVMVLLVASRAVFAMGAGAVMPGAMALAADLSARENRLKAMSLLAAATSFGSIIGPATAAVFTGIGLAAPFYVIAAVALAGAVLSRLVLPETRIGRPTVARPKWRRLLAGGPGLIAIGSLLYMCGCFGIFSIIGFHVQDKFQLASAPAAQWMGLGLMMAALSNVAAQGFIIRQIKTSPMRLLIVGVPITILAMAVVAQSSTLPMFVLGMALNGLGQGFANPAFATALSLSVGAGEQGRIAGVSASMQALAFLFAPVSSAALYQTHSQAVFVVGSLLVFAALGPFVLSRRKSPPAN